MKTSKLFIDLYDIFTFPVALIGYLWYFLIETPLFVGRMRANEQLTRTAYKAEEEGEEDG